MYDKIYLINSFFLYYPPVYLFQLAPGADNNVTYEIVFPALTSQHFQKYGFSVDNSIGSSAKEFRFVDNGRCKC